MIPLYTLHKYPYAWLGHNRVSTFYWYFWSVFQGQCFVIENRKKFYLWLDQSKQLQKRNQVMIKISGRFTSWITDFRKIGSNILWNINAHIRILTRNHGKHPASFETLSRFQKAGYNHISVIIKSVSYSVFLHTMDLTLIVW